MKKSEAINVFGNGTKLADAMGVTKQFVSQLPDDLPQKYVDWIMGAAVRHGVDKQFSKKKRLKRAS